MLRLARLLGLHGGGKRGRIFGGGLRVLVLEGEGRLARKVVGGLWRRKRIVAVVVVGAGLG